MQNQNSNNFNPVSNQKLMGIEDHLEIIMSKIPPQHSKKEKGCYLAGIIDCLYEVGMINDSERDNIYLRYVA